jgi:hypothetical protein
MPPKSLLSPSTSETSHAKRLLPPPVFAFFYVAGIAVGLLSALFALWLFYLLLDLLFA